MHKDNNSDAIKAINILMANMSEKGNPEGPAMVFDLLLGCMPENDCKIILNFRRKWLSSNDSKKVFIALLMEGPIKFESREQMLNVLGDIMKKWPRTKDECDRIIREWDEQYKNSRKQ